jgi:hypothetical protein
MSRTILVVLAETIIAPPPSMVIPALVIAGNALARLMAPVTEKVMVCGPAPAALALRIACLNDPGPVSFVVVTGKLAAMEATDIRKPMDSNNTALQLFLRKRVFGLSTVGQIMVQ